MVKHKSKIDWNAGEMLGNVYTKEENEWCSEWWMNDEKQTTSRKTEQLASKEKFY